MELHLAWSDSGKACVDADHFRGSCGQTVTAEVQGHDPPSFSIRTIGPGFLPLYPPLFSLGSQLTLRLFTAPISLLLKG